MPSARGSAIPMVIAGIATALSVATYQRLEAVKEDISYAPGAVIATSDVYMVTTSEKPSACIRSNSGGVHCYETEVLASSGKYLTAEIAVPSSFQSGAVIRTASVDCGSTPVAMSGTLAIHPLTKQSLAAGTILKRNVRVGSGSLSVINTGATIITKVPSGQYIAFVGTGGASITAGSFQGANCALNIELREKYGK